MGILKCKSKIQEGKASSPIPMLTEYKATYTGFEMAVVDLISIHREEKGLKGKLQRNDTLSSIALQHSQNMAFKHEISHKDFPKRVVLAQQLASIDWLGEIIAGRYGTAKGVVNAWIRSEKHHEIMLSDKAKRIGISAEMSTNARLYITVLFSD